MLQDGLLDDEALGVAELYSDEPSLEASEEQVSEEDVPQDEEPEADISADEIPSSEHEPVEDEVADELRQIFVEELHGLHHELDDEVAKLSTLGEMAPACLLYTSPSPRDKRQSRMPSSA